MRTKQHCCLSRLLSLYLCVAAFTGYMSVEHEHPPSHTQGGAHDCDCPGDWAPDSGSRPTSARIVAGLVGLLFLTQQAAPVAESPLLASPQEAPATIPRRPADLFELPALLI